MSHLMHTLHGVVKEQLAVSSDGDSDTLVGGLLLGKGNETSSKSEGVVVCETQELEFFFLGEETGEESGCFFHLVG